MNEECIVVYITSRLAEARHPQLDAILTDLSRIYSITLIGRGNPDKGPYKRNHSAWKEIIIPTPLIKGYQSSAMLFAFWRLGTEIRRAISEIRPRVIYAINLDALVAVGSYVIRRCPIIYHALEIYGQTEGVHYRRLWETLEHILIRRASLLIVPSRLRAEYYMKIYGNQERTLIWLNAPSINQIEEIAIHLMSNKSKPNGPIELLYPGGLSKKRDLVPFIKGLRILKQNNIECRLTILSRDHEYYNNILNVSAFKNGVSDLLRKETYLENRTDLIKRIAQCNYLIARYSPTTANNRLCAPTKLVDAFLAATPWIADDIEGTRAWNTEFGGGILCNLEDPESIAVCLSSGYAQPYKISLHGLVAYQKAVLEKVRLATAIL